MSIRQKRVAITLAGITMAVLIGTLAWNPLAGTDDGQGDDSLTVEPGRSGSETMTAREQRLLDETEELKRRLAEAEARADRARMENEETGEPGAEDFVAAEEVPLEVRFTDDKYAEALAGVDWEVVGTAMKEMVPNMALLAEALLEGDLPLELAGQVQQLNGQLLAQLQPLMDGEVPGTGPNGTFTHPLVVANQMDHALDAAELPLSEAQSESLEAITNHYLALDENLRLRAEGYELSLEALLEETAMKDRMREEMERVLSPEQRSTLYPETVQDYNGLDLFGTGLVWAQYAKPAPVSGPEDLARRNFSRFSEGLQLREDQQESLRPLIDSWSRSYPADYWSDTANALETQGMLKTSRTRIAAERQLALFQSMLNNLGLTAEQREKLAQNSGIMVPLVK